MKIEKEFINPVEALKFLNAFVVHADNTVLTLDIWAFKTKEYSGRKK